jgi:hypothetical protein
LFVQLRVASEEYAADGDSPRRKTQYRSHLTIWSGEEDLAEIGAVVQGPNEGEQTTVVVIRSNQPRTPCRGVSGLACRERMQDDSATLFPVRPQTNDDPPLVVETNPNSSWRLSVCAYLTVEPCQVYFADGAVYIVRTTPLDG